MKIEIDDAEFVALITGHVRRAMMSDATSAIHASVQEAIRNGGGSRLRDAVRSACDNVAADPEFRAAIVATVRAAAIARASELAAASISTVGVKGIVQRVMDLPDPIGIAVAQEPSK